jgi:hypothetical protein
MQRGSTARENVPLAGTSRGGGRRLGVEGEEHRNLLRAGLDRRRPGILGGWTGEKPS